MQPTRYAQRLLNPFRGIMNIIEYQGAEAVSTDGCHWDIYVRDTSLVADLGNAHKVQTSDIRYGSWSLRQGLKRGALYPSDDFKQLEMLGALVYEYLLEHHADVPFPLRDRYELWLLDTGGMPLALLNSAVSENAIDLDEPLDWRAGNECRRSFSTPLTDTLGVDGSAGEYLTDMINARAGTEPRAQWFVRNDDGAGEGLTGVNLPAELGDRRLPATAFPDLFVQPAADPPEQRQLLQAFFDWQAPYLLLLAHLNRAQRIHYERCARSRAVAVERQHRLYPEVIDHDLIKAARVEAMLRSGETGGEIEDEILATYYIELNVTRTN